MNQNDEDLVIDKDLLEDNDDNLLIDEEDLSLGLDDSEELYLDELPIIEEEIYGYELGMESEFDLITEGVQSLESAEMPENYILVTNLILLEQIVGALEEDNLDLFILPVYAEKNGKLKHATFIEVTTHNIMMMKLGGLGVEIVMKDRPNVTFDNAEDYVKVIKTLRSEDTNAVSYLVDSEDGIIKEELHA